MTKKYKISNRKLYYVHGYQSSPISNKGILFKQKINAMAIKYRDCKPEDIMISDCLLSISNVIKNDKHVVLIGSSLGGYLSVKTAFNHSNVEELILLNPAIIPPSTDLNTIDDMPKRILNDIKDRRLFENKLNAKITILRGTADELVPDKWVLDFAKAQEATVVFLHDDHRFTRYLNNLPDIIFNIIKT